MKKNPGEKVTLPDAVPAKEFARKIGEYQRQALVKPVTITAYGQPTHVLLSVAEYRRLKLRDREALAVDELTPAQAEELLAALEASRPSADSDEHDDELIGWKP